MVELEDRYELKEWKEPMRLNLMTSLRMDTSSPGEVRVGDRYVIAYDARTLSAAAEEIPLSDEHLRSVWGDRVARLVLTTHGTALQGGYRVVLREVK